MINETKITKTVSSINMGKDNYIVNKNTILTKIVKITTIIHSKVQISKIKQLVDE